MKTVGVGYRALTGNRLAGLDLGCDVMVDLDLLALLLDDGFLSLLHLQLHPATEGLANFGVAYHGDVVSGELLHLALDLWQNDGHLWVVRGELQDVLGGQAFVVGNPVLLGVLLVDLRLLVGHDVLEMGQSAYLVAWEFEALHVDEVVVELCVV